MSRYVLRFKLFYEALMPNTVKIFAYFTEDIDLNTQYLVLLNKSIDRQQVATLARRIYPSASVAFMRKFKDAMARPHRRS